MWTVENRGSYDRGGLRYPSDVTDDEWAHIGRVPRGGVAGWRLVIGALR